MIPWGKLAAIFFYITFISPRDLFSPSFETENQLFDSPNENLITRKYKIENPQMKHPKNASFWHLSFAFFADTVPQPHHCRLIPCIFRQFPKTNFWSNFPFYALPFSFGADVTAIFLILFIFYGNFQAGGTAQVISPDSLKRSGFCRFSFMAAIFFPNEWKCFFSTVHLFIYGFSQCAHQDCESHLNLTLHKLKQVSSQISFLNFGFFFQLATILPSIQKLTLSKIIFMTFFD